jgi:hypothetical protein
MDVRETTNAEIAFSLWSAAEFLDMPASGLVLRAMICRVGDGKWQWSIMSIEGDSEGRLICAGLEKTIGDARLTAAAELDNCIHDPMA